MGRLFSGGSIIEKWMWIALNCFEINYDEMVSEIKVLYDGLLSKWFCS